MFELVVHSPFDGHDIGERITDDAAVHAALRDHPDKVIKVASRPDPAPKQGA